MNDNDIDLISSLIGGDLSEPDQADAFARIGSDPELQAAYDEQLAVASMLESTPDIAMTADEAASLRAALRTELRLDEATVAVAMTPSGWSRWWVPLTGVAVAAAVVFAIAILPGALDGTDTAEVVSAPSAETTAPASELGTLSDDRTLLQGETEAAPETAPTTTAAANDQGATEEFADAPTSEYFLEPQFAREARLELPVLDEDAVAAAGVESALTLATEAASVDLSALGACFAAGAAGSALELVGITPDLSTVYAIATDLETGIETSLTVDLSTCQVSGAG